MRLNSKEQALHKCIKSRFGSQQTYIHIHTKVISRSSTKSKQILVIRNNLVSEAGDLLSLFFFFYNILGDRVMALWILVSFT